jgi:hypothetical protein
VRPSEGGIPPASGRKIHEMKARRIETGDATRIQRYNRILGL